MNYGIPWRITDSCAIFRLGDAALLSNTDLEGNQWFGLYLPKSSQPIRLEDSSISCQAVTLNSTNDNVSFRNIMHINKVNG